MEWRHRLASKACLLCFTVSPFRMASESPTRVVRYTQSRVSIVFQPTAGIPRGAFSQHLRACSFAANRDSPLFFAAFLIKGSNPTPAQPPTRPAGDAGEHFLPACHFSDERGEMLIQSTQVIRDKDRTRSLPIPGPWDLPFAVLMPSTPGPDQFTVRPPF